MHTWVKNEGFFVLVFSVVLAYSSRNVVEGRMLHIHNLLSYQLAVKYSELLYEPDSSVIGGLTLSKLYDTASHKKDEFIQQ